MWSATAPLTQSSGEEAENVCWDNGKDFTVILLQYVFVFFHRVSQPSGKQFYQWGSQTDSWSFSHLSNQSINLSANKLVSHSASQWLHQPGMVRSEKLSPLTVVKDVPSDSVNSSRNMLLCCFICHYGSPPASVGRSLSPFPQERHQKPFLTITCY